jgi:hypothetical protein
MKIMLASIQNILHHPFHAIPNPKEMTMNIAEYNATTLLRWLRGAHKSLISFGKFHAARRIRVEAHRAILEIRAARQA